MSLREMTLLYPRLGKDEPRSKSLLVEKSDAGPLSVDSKRQHSRRRGAGPLSVDSASLHLKRSVAGPLSVDS